MKKTTLLTISLCICIVGLHLGYDKYLSVQFFSFIVINIYLLSTLNKGNIKFTRLFGAVFGVLTIASALSYVVTDQSFHFLIKGIRTAYCAGLIAALAACESTYISNSLARAARNALYISGFLALVLASLQYMDSLTGNTGRFDIPAAWYAINYGTFLANLRQIYAASGNFARPSAFYSEPSALAAFGLVVGISGLRARRNILVVISLLLVLLSRSLGGYILLIGLFLFEGAGKKLAGKRLFLATSAILLALAASISFFSNRVDRILNGNDLSANIRIFEPLRTIENEILAGDFFGESSRTLMSRSHFDFHTMFDNWALNQLMWYGLLGAVILLTLLVVFPAKWRFLLVSFSLLNGDAFFYDRFILFYIAIAACAHLGTYDNGSSNYVSRDNYAK